ncbi:hypothetical protein [Rhodanobacter soli]
MARKRIAVTADIADPIILLHKGPEVIFDENFSDHLEGMPPHQRRKWLVDRSILLLDEYDDGAFDTNGELDPWEPD